MKFEFGAGSVALIKRCVAHTDSAAATVRARVFQNKGAGGGDMGNQSQRRRLK